MDTNSSAPTPFLNHDPIRPAKRAFNASETSPMKSRGGLPRYQQIALVLESRIASRDWSAGEQIPSETDLADQFNVSIMTVRQGLAILVEKGLLNRRHGRGTFVASSGDDDSAKEARLSATMSDVAAEMLELQVEPIDIASVRGPQWVIDTLGLSVGEVVIRARRRRHSDRGIVSYTISYSTPALARELVVEDLRNTSLVALIETRHGVHFSDAAQTIEAAIADPEAATMLDIAAGAPVLLVRRIYHLAGGPPGYISLARYPSTMFRYHVQLTRQIDQQELWKIADPPFV